MAKEKETRLFESVRRFEKSLGRSASPRKTDLLGVLLTGLCRQRRWRRRKQRRPVRFFSPLRAARHRPRSRFLKTRPQRVFRRSCPISDCEVANPENVVWPLTEPIFLKLAQLVGPRFDSLPAWKTSRNSNRMSAKDGLILCGWSISSRARSSSCKRLSSSCKPRSSALPNWRNNSPAHRLPR